MVATSGGKESGHLYEIRRDGITHCHSSMENCGYSPKTIKEMQVAGFDLYIDGKKSKRKVKV